MRNVVKDREWKRLRRLRAKTEGKCSMCHVRLPRPNRLTCQRCIDNANERSRFYAAVVNREQFDRAYRQQDGHCKVCGSLLEKFGRNTHTDHDHATGQFRGLLCSLCNLGLGYFRDNPEILKNAIKYLAITGDTD